MYSVTQVNRCCGLHPHPLAHLGRPAPLSPALLPQSFSKPWSCIYNSSADRGVEGFMSLETTLSHWDESSMRKHSQVHQHIITLRFSKRNQSPGLFSIVISSPMHPLLLVPLFCLTLSTRSVQFLGITRRPHVCPAVPVSGSAFGSI